MASMWMCVAGIWQVRDGMDMACSLSMDDWCNMSEWHVEGVWVARGVGMWIVCGRCVSVVCLAPAVLQRHQARVLPLWQLRGEFKRPESDLGVVVVAGEAAG